MIFYKFLFFLSDFLEIQRKSFRLFLKNQFGEEFIAIPRSLTLNILYKDYKFLKPIFNIEESILLSKTYCCHFYIPVSLTHFSNRSPQWFSFGALPLLTRRGHFIINGTPRIVLNQIVRSPGVYFSSRSAQKENSQISPRFYAEIISKRGPWIRLEMDLKHQIWVSIQGQLKMPFISFFKNLCSKTIQHHFFLQEKEKSSNSLLGTRGSAACDPTDQRFNQQQNQRWHFKKNTVLCKNPIFWNPSILILEKKKKNLRQSAPLLDLGKVGRLRLNQKCGIFMKTSNLTPLDFLAIRDKL